MSHEQLEQRLRELGSQPLPPHLSELTIHPSATSVAGTSRSGRLIAAAAVTAIVATGGVAMVAAGPGIPDRASLATVTEAEAPESFELPPGPPAPLEEDPPRGRSVAEAAGGNPVDSERGADDGDLGELGELEKAGEARDGNPVDPHADDPCRGVPEFAGRPDIDPGADDATSFGSRAVAARELAAQRSSEECRTELAGPDGTPASRPDHAGPPADLPAGPPADLPAGPPADVPAGPPADVPAGPPADVPPGPPADVPAGPPTDVPAGPPTEVPAGD